MKIKSHAKINLTLDVLKKNGRYHQIQTVLQQLDLHDLITFKVNPKSTKIVLNCQDPSLPLGQKNTIIKAANLLKNYAQKSSATKSGQATNGINITLKKNIPIASGLGGGSSNAATTLVALNKIWKLRLSKKTLMQLGAKIGMDVPFFIKGGTALGTHFGEKVQSLAVLPKQYMILVKKAGAEKQSTAQQYQLLENLEKENPGTLGKNKSQTRQLVNLLKNKKMIQSKPQNTDFYSLFHNDFDHMYKPKAGDVKNILLRSGAACVHICGSGPTHYALFNNRAQQLKAYKQLIQKNNNLKYFLTKTV